MAITIKNQTAHEAALQPLLDGTTETKTTTATGGDDPPHIETEQAVEHVMAPPDWEQITVGMGFKLPIAQYTMVEFTVSRTKPSAPDEVDATYDEVKNWVEERMNQLVADQQSA